MNNKRKLILSIGLVLVLVIMIVGISYATFQFSGPGSKVNTITTGAITMEYTESDNTINITGSLPTTDETGMKRLNEGEYFDFTVKSNIVGNTNINWEISTKKLDGNTIDGKYIKFYLTKINGNQEEALMEPSSYLEASEENSYTGRPSNEMSLYTSSMQSSEEATYRLRMWVDESYNPQGDGGNLQFGVKVNVYGKVGDRVLTLAQKVLADNELQVEKAHMFNYTSNGLTSGSTTPDSDYVTNGLYSTEDEDGTSYYYRGNVVNNNVQFGEYQEDYYVYKYDKQYFQSLETCQSYNSSCSESNTTKVKLASKGDKMYWKIVRINGDGSARLIYNGTNPTATYDANDLSTWKYVGLSSYSPSYKFEYGLSNTKIEVDTWYEKSLASGDYDKYVLLGKFCNDMSDKHLTNSSAMIYQWASNERLNNIASGDNNPLLICPNNSDNYALKAGLINADEVLYAGSISGTQSGYLTDNSTTYNFYTMTPLVSSSAAGYAMWNEKLTSNSILNPSAIRPVINVSGSVTENVDGTVNNPYIIK
mgnify:CR=1 FL=1